MSTVSGRARTDRTSRLCNVGSDPQRLLMMATRQSHILTMAAVIGCAICLLLDAFMTRVWIGIIGAPEAPLFGFLGLAFSPVQGLIGLCIYSAAFKHDQSKGRQLIRGWMQWAGIVNMILSVLYFAVSCIVPFLSLHE